MSNYVNLNQLNVTTQQQTLNSFLSKQFGNKYLSDLSNLVKIIIANIAEFSNESYSKSLNSSLAYFLNDSISLIDRGLVFRLIEVYLKEHRYL